MVGGVVQAECLVPPTPPPHLGDLPTHLRETDADPFFVLAGSPDAAVLRGSDVGLREGFPLSRMVLCGSIAPDPVDFGVFLPSLDQSDLQGSRSHPCRPSLVQLCQVVHVRSLLDDIIHLMRVTYQRSIRKQMMEGYKSRRS